MKKITFILNIAIFAIMTQFLFASSPDWEDDPAGYEFTATISGAVILNDGVQMGGDGDIFAAFDDAGNVRGIALELSPPFGPYMGTPVFEMQVRSNAADDHITFMYYDSSVDAILDISEDYTFVINDIIGDVTDPWIMNVGAPDLGCPECSDNDSGVSPFTCASAVASFGCEFEWGGAPISASCPESCGTCPVEDGCGVCEGDNSSCDDGCGPNQPGPSGCDNACGSDLVNDDCGECGGDNSSCDDGCGPNQPGPSGCDNTCGSDLVNDDCGVCGGDGSDDVGCGCFEAGPSGCDDECGSTAVEDCAGVCDGSSVEGFDACVTPADYQFNGSVTTSVLIDDLEVGDGDIVGAFVGDEARGIGTATIFPPTDEYIFSIMMFSNVASGETMQFKYYNVAANLIIDMAELVEFESDMIVGNGLNPFVLTPAPTDVTTDISIESGWNWFSLNVTSDDMSLNTVMASMNSSMVETNYIKDQDNYADYYGGFGWWGPLEEFNNEDMYKLKSNGDEEALLAFTGNPVDPSMVPITITAGWNWIGYTPQESMDLNSALATLSGSSAGGDYIKNQDNYADFYDGFGWWGPLEMSEPYEGYMLKSASDGVLTYPSDALLSFDPSNDAIDESLTRNVDAWDVKSSDFEFNGSITAEVKLGDNEVSAGDVLAAFDGDECRGVAHAASNPFGEHLIFPLMVYGNDENTSMSFKYYDSLSGEVINITEKVVFESDMALGNAIETVVLNSASSVSGLVSQFELKAAYPNPFNPTTSLDYSLDVEGDINISILDVNGRVVDVLYNGFSDVGHNSINWDASYSPSGVYFVKLISGNKVQTQKIVLVK